MKKAIVTVVGKDKVGIISAVTQKLAQYQINVLDITQTVLQEYFTMVMLVDMDQSNELFKEIKTGLDELGETLELSIRIQHEDIFNSMHRI